MSHIQRDRPPTAPRVALTAALVFAGWLLGTSTFPPSATAQTREEARAFRDVISAQVEAFRQNAWDRAFSFASPGIRAMFATSDRFREMVLGGYEAVARPRVFEFEEATTIDGNPAQPAFVVGPDGAALRAVYFMERQPDGSWKIDAVVIQRLPDRTS